MAPKEDMAHLKDLLPISMVRLKALRLVVNMVNLLYSGEAKAK